MTIDALIEHLEKLRLDHGNLEVYICDLEQGPYNPSIPENISFNKFYQFPNPDYHLPDRIEIWP